MNIIEKAIKYPITVSVGVIISLMAGLLVLSLVPVRMTPTVDSVYLAVDTLWENASPEQIESDVITPQEKALGNLNGLVTMVSTSSSSAGNVVLEFKTGTNINIAMQKVVQKLDEVPLYPKDVNQPIVTLYDPTQANTIAWAALASTDVSFDTTTLSSFMIRRLQPRLERIEGISKVNIMGNRDSELTINIDAQVMANRGLTYKELLTVLQEKNENYSAGLLNDGKNQIQVQTTGRYNDIEKLRNLVIKRTENGLVRLNDFAQVSVGYKKSVNWLRVRGIRMPMFSFDLEYGANLLEVMDKIKTELAYLNRPNGALEQKAKQLGLNGTLELVQVYDTSLYVKNAISLVKSNIIAGGILATLSLLLFMRSFSAIGVISIAIPISIIASIVVLVCFGRSVNIVSLSGMAFAVGMVIDNAIVVLENIYRHIEMGKTPAKAAAEGTKEVSPAIFAATLTTIAVFIPILFIQDSAGQLFKDIALVIMAAVAVSFVVSIIVIPALATKMLKSIVDSEELRSFERIEKVVRTLPLQVAKLVNKLIHGWKRRISVIVLFVILTITGIKMLAPPMDYLPKGNFNVAIGVLIPPPEYNLEKISEIGTRIEEKLKPAWMAGGAKFSVEKEHINDKKLASTTMMIDGDSVEAPAIEHYFMGAYNGMMFQATMPVDSRRTVDLVDLLSQSAVSAEVPDMVNFAYQLPLFQTAGSTGSAISINLLGDDLDLVNKNASTLMNSLTEKYGPYSTLAEPANFLSPGLGLQLIPNDERLSRFQLTREDLGLATAANGDGIVLLRIFEIDGELKDIKVLTEQSSIDNPLNSLLFSKLTTPNGQVVDISNVAEAKRMFMPAVIRHVDRLRAVSLQLTPPDGVPIEVAIDEINGMVKSLRSESSIDASIDVTLSGTAGKLNDIKVALMGDGSFTSMLTSSMFLALVFVFLVMVVLFQNWLYPLVVMITVPLATLGGFWGLSIVHAVSVTDRYQPVQNMDVITLLGFVILAGVVVNNAILIVHKTLKLLTSKTNNLTYNKAILESLKTRVRPIFMSTLTSIGGMLPLVLMSGPGSELYRGLGAVVVGGLFVATLFTLILVPILLSCIFALNEKHWYINHLISLIRPEEQL